MVANGMTHAYTNDAAELPRRLRMAFLGDTRVQLAKLGNTNLNDLSIEGWQDVGYITSLSPTRNVEYVELRTGSPEGNKGNLLTGDDLEFGITYTHPTYLGWKVAQGSTYARTMTVASSGQTTVSSSTSKNITVVAAATGLAVGDWCEVDLTYDKTGTGNSTYGQYKELVMITAISSTTVTHTRLTQTPIAGADFLKVSGWGASADDGTAGIKYTIGAVDAPEYQMRTVTYLKNNQSLLIQAFPEVQILNPVPLDLSNSKELIATGFTAKVIQQHEASAVTLDDGMSVNSAPFLGRQYFLPYESA